MIHRNSINTDKKEIWIFCEYSNDEILLVTYEIISAAHELALKSDMQIAVIAIGQSAEKVIAGIKSCAIDKIYFTSNTDCMLWDSAAAANLLEQMINRYRPDIFLFPDTIYSKSIAARTAVRVNTGLTANCTSFDFDSDTGSLLQTRPAFSGNLLATIICRKSRPQMATIKKGVYPKCGQIVSNRDITIVKIGLKLQEPVEVGEIKLIDTISLHGKSDMKEKDIMVGIGAGAKRPETVKKIMEFADLLQAGICATRAAVNNNWLDYSYQVGLSGKVIRPKVYIAIGISGSVQHMIGIASNTEIIGINKDANAPIFNFCTYKIVGDIDEVLSALIASSGIEVCKQ